ncbi:MAG: NfeD family protein [Candidatus Bathyarchaeia archaeon]
MKVTLTIKADELKIAQLLSKFAEKYRMSYKLNRQGEGFLLDAELDSDDFGELMRRMNHLKDAQYKIEEMRGGGMLDRFNVSLTRTNVDMLIGKETLAKTDIDPLDGGVVKLNGELWLSRPIDDSVIKEGSKVRVVRIEGVTLIVEGVNRTECTNLNSP